MSGRLRRRAAARGDAGQLEISQAHGVHLVHPAGPPPEALTSVAARLSGVTGADETTVLVGAGFGDPEGLCARLRAVLEKSPDRTAPATGRLVRLVMSGAAAGSPGRPAPARALSDALGVDVLAPLGAALVTPDGTLFAPALPGRPGGWRRFSPGREPAHAGARHPAPRWQAAVERVVAAAADGCVVEQVPAGLLILPTGTPAEGVEALRYAVPPHADRVLLLIGAAHARAVPARAVADVLAALPATVRETVRLVSADGSDPLPVGRQVAALLGVPVEVGSGLPLLVGDPARPAQTRPGTPRAVLTDAAGEATWRPYVEEVVCEPRGDAEAAVRLGTWRPPVSGLRPALEPGALVLDRNWQVVVTRSGLWVGPNGTVPPAATVARSIEPDVMAVEIGLPDQALPDTVWEPLERLFSALQDDVRDRTQIRLHGEPADEVLNGMRRLAVRHGLALAPRGWQDTGPRHESGPSEPAPSHTGRPAASTTAAPVAGVPDPPAPESPEPGMSAPEPLEPGPYAPEPTEPEPYTPRSPEPEPAEPGPYAPEPPEPGPYTPEPAEPEPYAPQPYAPESPEPAPRTPQSPEPYPAGGAEVTGEPGSTAGRTAGSPTPVGTTAAAEVLVTPAPRAPEAVAITFTPPVAVPAVPTAGTETATRGPMA